MSTTEEILSFPKDSWITSPKPEKLTEQNSVMYMDLVIKNIPRPPIKFKGSGIVMCAGGEKYLLNAWININMIRHFGVAWPVKIWHLGQEEIPGNTKELFSRFDAEFIDGKYLAEYIPTRLLKGWELKCFALKWTPFEHIMFIDSDSFLTRDFTFIFNTTHYQKNSAIFWPDTGRLGKERKIWEIVGIPYRDEPEVEAGQMCINKNQCWDQLCLAMWMNEYSDLYYKHVHGDKETFHMAWRKMNKSYTLCPPLYHMKSEDGKSIGFSQQWFDLCPIFQHRNWNKYSLNDELLQCEAMHNVDLHLKYLNQFKELWKP